MNNCLYILFYTVYTCYTILYVFLQISIDDAILPGADGKIVAWVEEDWIIFGQNDALNKSS